MNDEKSYTPLFDSLEAECDRLIKKEGKRPTVIFLGKKQTEQFISELIEIQKVEVTKRKEMRELILKSEVSIDDGVSVVFTAENDEVRFETHAELLN